MPIDYKKLYKEQIRKNVQEVLEHIESEEMRVKIENWAEKFEYSFAQIKTKVREDKIFRCIFAKDPNKQSLQEKLASNYIASLKGVQAFQKLPSSGTNALYLSRGKIFKGMPSKDTKSIDFTWQYGNYIFYATHKYTEQDGGAQDNQYKDVQSFLNNARDCAEPKTIFLALCDGEYYQRKDSKTKDETRLKRLKRLTDGRTTFALAIDELEPFLKNITTHTDAVHP